MITYPSSEILGNKEQLTRRQLADFKEIEALEYHYLEKYYHFLKYAEDEMLRGFQTKEKIKDDWIDRWKFCGTSDFDRGAERIVYALLNGKGIGQPNSCPVGSDLFFEVENAFIHIDLKTVQTKNITDFSETIFVGINQNSYCGEIKKQHREYSPALPSMYTIKNDSHRIVKPCLTYFVSILYENENLNILCITLSCMPNGMLEPLYKGLPLRAGKLKHETRFNFSNIPYFEMLNTEKKLYPRIKVIYMNSVAEKYSNKLKFLYSILNSQ